MINLGLGSSAATFQTPTLAVKAIDNGNKSGSVYCPPDPDKFGDAWSVCKMVGSQYVLDSAADLLAASRFAGFRVRNSTECEATASADPGCKVYSSDSKTPWLVADFEISSRQSSRSVQSAKVVGGFAQLDLYLCSSSNCSTIADVQFVRRSDGERRVGVGISVITGTLVGVPSGILNHSTLSRSRLSRSDPSAGDDMDRLLVPSQPAEITQVFYDDSSRAWLCMPPNVMQFGVFAHLFKDSGWEAFRVGTYHASNLNKCVTIITPAHSWMDSHGWNRSHGCSNSESVYLFNSYFPQAFFNVSNGGYFVPDWDGDVFKPRDSINNRPSNLTFSQARESGYLNYSWSMDCQDEDKFEVRGRSCQQARQSESNENFTVLHIGTAAFLAVDLTESEEVTRKVMNEDVNVSCLRVKTWQFEQFLFYPHTVSSITDKTNLFANTQFKNLSGSITEEPPWCGGYLWKQFSINMSSSDFIDLKDTIADCDMWDKHRIGYVDIDFNGGDLGKLNSTFLSSYLTPRWIDVGQEIGFAGLAHPTIQSLEVAFPDILKIAGSKLSSQTALVLVSTDPTLTYVGGIAMLMTTIVSTIAIAVGCKDMEATLHKFCFRGKIVGVQVLFSRVVVCALTFGGVMVSPILVALSENSARQQNERGQSRKVLWLQVPALGEGDYRLQGVMSSTFTTEYDRAGQILMWVNFAISALATLLICYKVLTRDLPKDPRRRLRNEVRRDSYHVQGHNASRELPRC